PRPDKYWNLPIINKLKSRRDHCNKGSRRWKKLNKLIQKCFKKMRDQIKDFQHKLSNKLVNNTKANTIIVGDLDVKQMAQVCNNNKKAQKSLNYSTQNTGTLSRFVGFLTYKAQRIGKRVIAI
ncbi:MAG: transposase, partial [Methanosarcinales archaeon]